MFFNLNYSITSTLLWHYSYCVRHSNKPSLLTIFFIDVKYITATVVFQSFFLLSIWFFSSSQSQNLSQYHIPTIHTKFTLRYFIDDIASPQNYCCFCLHVSVIATIALGLKRIFNDVTQFVKHAIMKCTVL